MSHLGRLDLDGTPSPAELALHDDEFHEGGTPVANKVQDTSAVELVGAPSKGLSLRK